MLTFFIFSSLFLILQISSHEVCLTPECVRLAARYLNNMNPNVSPCDDFYEYSCGRYDSLNPLRENEKLFMAFSEISRDLNENLKGLFDTASRQNSTPTMSLALTYFDSCMDQKSIDARGVQPLQNLIQTLGGWTNESVAWEILAGNLSRHGIDSIFSAIPDLNPKNSSENLLLFSIPVLFTDQPSFYQQNISNNSKLESYRKYIVNSLEAINADISETLVDEIIDFEIKLFSISPKMNHDDHSKHTNLMTYTEFKSKYEFIDFDLYFGDYKFKEDQKVNCHHLKFFEDLGKLLNETSILTINTYLMWTLIRSYIDQLPVKIQEPAIALEKLINPAANPKTYDWKTCLSEVKQKLALPLATEFIHKFIKTEDKKVAEELVEDLRKAMREELLKVSWLDEETRKKAMEKLGKMKNWMGYPEFLNNQSAILKPFEKIQLKPDRYFNNAVALRKTMRKEQFKILKAHEAVIEWATIILQINAYNWITSNQIIFPAGILQFPIFVPGAPSFANYAAIGMIIGHEISHGYDNVGSQYDKNGDLNPWWDNQTLSKFKEKSQCFIDQYSNLTEPLSQTKMNGKLGIGENIGDNGGLRIAYEAYQKNLKRYQNSTQVLPGLSNFDEQQMFFLAYANTWCSTVKPEFLKNILETDPHSPPYFRVNVPLQNFPEFSENFKCPVGSKMNPANKCRVW